MYNIHKLSFLFYVLGFSSSVIAKNTDTMNCPAPENVKYVSTRYEAEETQKGWEGRWISRPQKKGEIASFVSAQYFSEKNNKAKGTLTNCTYKLRLESDVVDLEYHKDKETNDLETLIVSIGKQPYWNKEVGAIGIQGYECIKSALECKFTPLKIKSN